MKDDFEFGSAISSTSHRDSRSDGCEELFLFLQRWWILTVPVFMRNDFADFANQKGEPHRIPVW